MNLDPDYLQSTRVHIVIPCYGGLISDNTFCSAIKWAEFARRYNINWTMDSLSNESLIPRGRNVLVSRFLAQVPDATHILFLDADIDWEPWQLATLLTDDVDIIGGLYIKKKFPGSLYMSQLPHGESMDRLVEVKSVGAGFLLIKKHVFEKLNEHPAVKVHIDEDYEQIRANLKPGSYAEMTYRNYFDTSIRDNHYYSEYDTFCDNWRQLGGKIWVDKRVFVKHTGLLQYSKEVADYLYQFSGSLLLRELQQEGTTLVDKNNKETSLIINSNVGMAFNPKLIDENYKEIILTN